MCVLSSIPGVSKVFLRFWLDSESAQEVVLPDRHLAKGVDDGALQRRLPRPDASLDPSKKLIGAGKLTRNESGRPSLFTSWTPLKGQQKAAT